MNRDIERHDPDHDQVAAHVDRERWRIAAVAVDRLAPITGEEVVLTTSSGTAGVSPRRRVTGSDGRADHRHE